MSKRRVVWPVLVGMMSAAAPSLAQDMRVPVILTGAAARSGASTGIARPLGGWPADISNPSASWTEVAFPDGTSIVLERGADLVLRNVTRDPATGRWLVQATSTKGRLRIAASDNAEVQLTTGGATVRIPAASAVVRSGPDGSATLLSSGEIEVQHNGRTELIRRPSFSILFGDGGPQRQSNQQLATLIDSFAPVQSDAETVGSQSRQSGVPSSPGTTPVTYSTTPTTTQTVTTGPQQNNNPGGFAQTPGAPTSPGQGTSVLPGTIVTTPTPVTPALPHQSQSFALASGLIPPGGQVNFPIAPPGVNSLSSSVDSNGNFFSDGQPLATAIIQVDRTPINTTGTGRIRRFAPGTSGFPTGATPRDDSGIITVSGVKQPYTGLFNNLATSQLVATPPETFYDGIVKVGSLGLTLAQHNELPFNVQGTGYNISTLDRISVTDKSNDPVTQRPFLTFGVIGQGQSGGNTFDLHGVGYFGSGVFENGVTPALHADGTVGSLSGNPGTGLAAILGDSQIIPVQQLPFLLLTDSNFSNDPLGRDILRAQGGCSSCPQVTIDGQSKAVINTLDHPALSSSVFIVDKIHDQDATGQTADLDPRGIQPGERFFIIGGTAIPPVAVGQGLPGAPPGTVTRFAVSDGLNPRSFNGGGTATIAQQFSGPGSANQPVAFNQYNAFRPEETFVAGAPRGDTHLLVISTADGRNPALRTDFQIAATGASSASTSVGGINNFAGSLALAGATIGSSQIDPSRGVIAISAMLGSLGTDTTGLGAHMFPLFPLNINPNSPIGYFAVGQADEQQGAPGTAAGVQPGLLQAVGSPSPPGQFGYTRLATNVGTPPGLIAAGAIDYSGFAAGFAQTTGSGTNTLYGLTSAQLGDVRIVSNVTNTEFTATLTAQSTSVGEVAWDPAAAAAPNGVTGSKSVSFGTPAGAKPTTAIASAATFAGVVPGKAAMASVDTDVIQGVANHTGAIVAPGSNQMVNADLPASNEHLAWGFFLGDLATQAAGTQPDRVNLGFWVAGRPVSLQALQSLTGTATYAGGMVGNVVQQVGQVVQVKSATGQFAQQWNFSNRTGSINANFDGAQWNGVVASMPAGSQVFTGSGPSGTGRTLAVQGAFFHATSTIQTQATALSAANTPAAVGGVFGVTGGGYGANGVFVGGRR